MRVQVVKAKSLLTKSKLPDADYVINPYIGCCHGCIYCYAEYMSRFSGHTGEKWGEFMDVKECDKSFPRPEKLRGKTILIGSVTDPYNPLEKQYQKTRNILEQLQDTDATVEILTRSPLVTRDIDVLSKMKNPRVGISLSTLDANFARLTEQNAAPPVKRLEAMRRLKEAGIMVYAFIAPIFPYITDWRAVADEAGKYAAYTCFENLNLRGAYKKRVNDTISTVCPDIAEKFSALYRNKQSAAAYWQETATEILRYMAEKPHKIYFFHEKIKKGASQMKQGSFAGYKTNGYIVAASSPATESAGKVLACEKGGAAAAILKSASKTRLPGAGQRRCVVRDGLFYAKSTYNREIMPLTQGEKLVKDCKALGVTMPVAASITELTLEPADWVEDCIRMEAAGADAIQLDFFYIENLLIETNFEDRFIKLLHEVLRNTSIPVMPKLNISLPAGYAAYLLNKAGVRYVSLLDSIKTPAPFAMPELAGGCLSVFGGFMLPITAQYTDTLVKAGFEVCAGGGVSDEHGAMVLFSLGASCVQLATEVLLKGYEVFGAFNRHSDAFANVPVLRDAPAETPRYAVRHKKRCHGGVDCGGVCMKQVFCASGFDGCEGCGLCAALCPNGAIEIITS